MCVHLYLGIKCPYIVIMLSVVSCHFELDVLNLLACRHLMNNLVQCSHFLSEALRCVYNRHTWLQLNEASMSSPSLKQHSNIDRLLQHSRDKALNL